METYKSIIEHPVPEILYHYTTQEGLLGIVQKDEIWCTKIHYLNDEKEFSLALKIAHEYLVELKDKSSSEKEIEKINFLIKKVDSIELVNVCVCSFSEKGDLLSQWRAYGGERSGFSIGFDTETLKKMGSKSDFLLVRCIYEPKIQKKLISDLIDDKLKQDFQTGGWEVDPDRPRTFIALPQDHEFAQNLTTLAPIIKDQAFSEEQEWRLISRALSCTHANFTFRTGLSMITPFFKLKLDNDHCIKKIIVGPTPHLRLSVKGTETLLASKDLLQNIKVKESLIPYRNW